MLAGGDPLHLPPERFFNLIWYWLSKDADEAWLRKAKTRLWMPPKGVAPTPGSPWSPEAETAAFRGLAASLQGVPSPKKDTSR